MQDGELHAWHYQWQKPVRIAWEQGRITRLEPAFDEPQAGLWVAPGLFDLQVNGYGGIDFQRDNLQLNDLLTVVRELRVAGCTRFFPTLITDEWATLITRLRHLRSLRSQSKELQNAIPGWHIEGPFLSAQPGFCGAHDPRYMRDPRAEDILELRAAAGKERVLLTLAPEREGALQAIQLATDQGIIVSLGHTNASAELLSEAVAAGARAFTHLGNGCPRSLDRHDNILWRIFETPGLMTSLIPDQIHVSPPLFRLVHNVIGSDRIYYTTDAMAAAGAPPGIYPLGKLTLEVGPDQVVRQPGKELFAGSALRPLEGIRRASQMLGCPWQEAWTRFSDQPARLLGWSDSWALGDPVNFCVLTSSTEEGLQLRSVIGTEA